MDVLKKLNHTEFGCSNLLDLHLKLNVIL